MLYVIFFVLYDKINKSDGDIMDSVNKTLYIPLYGKALVNELGIILRDQKASDIWKKEGFELNRKSKSTYLAYFIAMRARVFDDWVKDNINKYEDSTVIHIGCGLDSRCLRVNTNAKWYDIDFKEVIDIRKNYYSETDNYHMIGNDIREISWDFIDSKNVIVVMEGISMYMKYEDIQDLFYKLYEHFNHISLLMDCYSEFGAKMSKYKNPVHEVGVSDVYGLDNPDILNHTGIKYIASHELTPIRLINELSGIDKIIFNKLYSGNMAKKIYKLYEFRR